MLVELPGLAHSLPREKLGLRTTLDELAQPLVELQERLIEAEDPYFELKNGGLRALKRLFELEGVLAQLTLNFSEIRIG